MWLGVSSSGSTETWVSGQEFIINSTLVLWGRFRTLSFEKCDRITLLKAVIKLSQQPPLCGAQGGMKLHWVPCLTTCRFIWTRFRALILFLSSFSAPIKFVQLSENISDGHGRWLIKRCIAITQLSVVSEWATSRWTARVDKHIKRTPHIFSYLRPTVMFDRSKIIYTGKSRDAKSKLLLFLEEVPSGEVRVLHYQSYISSSLLF